jgi:hypothetical protein
MVLAGKVFLVKEEIDLDGIAARLKGFRAEGKEEIGLVTEIKDLKLEGEDIHAIFSQDRLIDIYHHGKKATMPITIEAPLIFSNHEGRIILTIVEKKPIANSIANQLSKILFITAGAIVEAKIPPETFRKFHEENFEDTKIVFFDDVDIPNVEKLSLYGSGLADTGLYQDYLKHGKVWYVVIKPKQYPSVVGVTRNSVITFFSKAEVGDLMDYVKKEIFPLIPQD